MAVYKLGILKGDDIGLEVVPEAVKVLNAAVAGFGGVTLDWCELPVGYPSYLKSGETLPASTLEALYGLDGWILGPIGHMAYPKDDPKAINPHPILRRNFDLASNIRPARSHPSLPCLRQDVDLVIIRENNEGFQPDRNMYKGMGECMPTPDMALSLRVITRRNSSMVARTAFELARQRNGKKKVTAIHKNTVFKLGCGLFIDTCTEVSKEYPDVEFGTAVVDTFAMHLVMRPANFDVVVTTNMFGDILSDEAAGLVGGLGMAPGLCVGPRYAMAQATHGSAPDIAGKNIANPYAMIMSAQMLLSWLGNGKGDGEAVQAAGNIEAALGKVLSDKKCVTPDLGGTAGTDAMGDAVCRALAAL
ncbi:3-isopropylmalate dehydrogenase [Aminivibrio pyruvatiphilus]|uniref:3-isopropylmalate dehydrogenase n=1 Tax=Aminivibrio pyruvatiphilus TaxID=1005740 RepID=A0A4R8M7F3_9BACT|nr:isocitrate/isopropylmalate dehydrogenase family protein [Aminivibrio pyruvatiphilus]TDY59536.1 3-isopropylmalate dehydrogenase [Aminivibrio pyruvatiphilus]